MSDFLNYFFLGKKFEPAQPIMTIKGSHYIDLPLQSTAGSGENEKKTFFLQEYSRIEWTAASLEVPTFSLVRGTALGGANYSLEYTLNVHGNFQSHRTAGLKGPMAILDILIFKGVDTVVEYLPRFGLFEFACGENNVKRIAPVENETDIQLREAHEIWRHSFHTAFDDASFIRVSFQVQPAFFKYC